MLLRGRGFASVKLDASSDLVGICSAVAQRRIGLGARKRRLFDERPHRIWLFGEIVEPHRDLPHIGTAKQAGAPTGWPIAKHDQRMLLTTSPFLGIAAQAIRERLPGGPRA